MLRRLRGKQDRGGGGGGGGSGSGSGRGTRTANPEAATTSRVLTVSSSSLPSPDRSHGFLSHTGMDDTACRFTVFLQNEAERSGISCFCDYASIPPGEPWEEYIEKSVQTSRAFVAILSPAYCERYWCMRELDLAIQHGVRVLPVYYSLSGPQELPHEKETFLSSFLTNYKNRIPGADLHRWWDNVQHLKKIQGIRRKDGKDADLPLKEIVVTWLARHLGVKDCTAEARQIQAEETEGCRAVDEREKADGLRSQCVPVDAYQWISATIRGLKLIRFRNTLDVPIYLWVYDSPEQLQIGCVSDAGGVGTAVPHGSLIARRSQNLRNGRGEALPVQAGTVGSGVMLRIYLQSSLALITFAVRDENVPSDLVILQHQRRVPINHIFTFQQFHLIEPKWRITLGACSTERLADGSNVRVLSENGDLIDFASGLHPTLGDPPI